MRISESGRVWVIRERRRKGGGSVAKYNSAPILISLESGEGGGACHKGSSNVKFDSWKSVRTEEDSRLEQGSREIHKLFAKELKLWENSPLYIVRKEEAVHRAASMTNRRSSADKFPITDYQFQSMRTAAMLVHSHNDK